jgi:hypothetical protein
MRSFIGLGVAILLGTAIFGACGDSKKSGPCGDAKLHMCNQIGNVGCKYEVMDNAQKSVVDACGQEEADRFFGKINGECTAGKLPGSCLDI